MLWKVLRILLKTRKRSFISVSSIYMAVPSTLTLILIDSWWNSKKTLLKPDPQLPKKLFYLFEWKPFKDDEIENSFCFLRSFILKLTETAYVLLKTALGIFNIVFCLWDSLVFHLIITETLNIFNTLTLKQIFLKMKHFFQKTEVFLLSKSTKIENATFSYKTALSETNLKTSRPNHFNTNRPIRNNRVLPVTNTLFL